MTESEWIKDINRRVQQEMHRRDAVRNKKQEQYMISQYQAEMNAVPRQQYAVIVAVDLAGGFSKDGVIPWNYPDDLEWFKMQTTNHICVMGRKTYDDINQRMGSKGDESVLPNRRCFVVTSTPLPKNNATAVSCIGEVDKYLTPADAESTTVFFIGGESVYREGIAKSNTAYITVVNKEVEADKFFPVKYLMRHFRLDKMFKHEGQTDLRFTVWKRQ